MAKDKECQGEKKSGGVVASVSFEIFLLRSKSLGRIFTRNEQVAMETKFQVAKHDPFRFC